MQTKNLQKIINQMYIPSHLKKKKNRIKTIVKKLIKDMPLDLKLETKGIDVKLRARDSEHKASNNNYSSLYDFELIHDESASITELRGLELLDKERYKAMIYTERDYGERLYLKLIDKKYQAAFIIKLNYTTFHPIIF